MSLFTGIKSWEDGVVPTPSFTIMMLGFDFGPIEYVFFAAVKGTKLWTQFML